MAVSSDMYQRGLAQRAGAQGGFDPYSTVGWDKRKPDWDTNWQQWEVNREYAGDDGRQVRGRFSSPSAGYSDMLSGTLTGPSGGRAGGSVNVALNNNFGRGTATNPAAEIGKLDRTIGTARGLFDGISDTVQGVVGYTRNLRRVQAHRDAVQSGINGQTAPVMSNTPLWWEAEADKKIKDKELSKAGKAAVEKALGKGTSQGVSFPPAVDTNDEGSANAAKKGGSRNTTRGTRKKTQEGTSNGS